MGRVIAFDVVGKPEPKGSTRAVVTRRKDGHLAASVYADNPRSRPWQDAIGWSAKAAVKGTRLVGPVFLSLSFYVARPKRGGDHLPTRKPDLDKLIRAVLDGLTGAAYDDDSQVVAVSARKEYGTPPRVAILAAEMREESC